MNIYGNLVGNLSPRANWKQEDPTKADYIHGHEEVNQAIEAAKETADAAEIRKLQFNNTVVAVAAFAENYVNEDFPYRAAIALEGVQNTMIPEVIFSLNDAVSGLFASAAESYNGGIYIYASEVPEADVTIPAIILWRGNLE